MKKKILNSFLVLGITFGITGCLLPTPKLETVNTGMNTNELEFKYNFSDSINKEPISKAELINGINETLLSTENITKRAKKYDVTGGGIYCEGLNLENLDNELSISYYFGDCFENTTYFQQIEKKQGHYAVAHIPFVISGDKNNFTLKTKYPDKFEYREYLKKVYSISQVKNEIGRMFDSFDNIVVKRKYTLSDSLISKYDLESAKNMFSKSDLVQNCNFDCSRKVWQRNNNDTYELFEVNIFDLEVSNVKKLSRYFPLDKNNYDFNYNIKYKDKLYPIMLKVYNYNNSVKVEYKIIFEYELDSKNKSNLSLEDVNAMNNQVKRIFQ